MDTDLGRLYVAMAQQILDRADIVSPSGGCVADKWPLGVTSRLHGHCLDTSAPRAEADVIDGKADVEIEGLLSARGNVEAPKKRRGRKPKVKVEPSEDPDDGLPDWLSSG